MMSGAPGLRSALGRCPQTTGAPLLPGSPGQHLWPGRLVRPHTPDTRPQAGGAGHSAGDNIEITIVMMSNEQEDCPDDTGDV